MRILLHNLLTNQNKSMKSIFYRILDLFKKSDPKIKGKTLEKVIFLETGIACEHWISTGSTYIRTINYKSNGYQLNK